jgi:hypothetical protein
MKGTTGAASWTKPEEVRTAACLEFDSEELLQHLLECNTGS